MESERALAHLEAFLSRRILHHLAVDNWHRQRSWRERISPLRSVEDLPVADRTAEVDLRDSLVRLLIQLPPQQRAVIVARYWEQLTEAEAARVLGCPVGTVKSATSRGLRRLRELSESDGVASGPAKERKP